MNLANLSQFRAAGPLLSGNEASHDALARPDSGSFFSTSATAHNALNPSDAETLKRLQNETPISFVYSSIEPKDEKRDRDHAE